MLGRPEEDMGTCVHADESQPPQDPREVSWGNWAAFTLTGALVSSGPAVRFRKMWARITLPGGLGRLRSSGRLQEIVGPHLR